MGAILGRETELEAVERFLEAVPAGPSALVIEGEAGIGKTTVWVEGVRVAAAHGYRVLQARPAESEATLSYAALADLVGDAFDEVRSALPAPQERALATALLRLEASEAVDPRTTATALVGVLTALAVDTPVVVAIDDIQWFDPASTRAVEFAVRRLPSRAGLFVTRRIEGDVEAPLGLRRAVSEERLQRLVPAPLSLAAVHHLIAARLGTAPARPTLARISAASAGNPFFALEIARALERDSADYRLGDPLPVPESVQGLALARVRALPAAAQEAVLVAAALSRPTVSAIVEALGGGDADPRSAIAQAEDAGVLVSDRERIRFTHPLLASAVLGAASSLRRRRLHERLAEVVDDREERARHRAASATSVDVTTASELEQVAAEAALRGAQDAAAELFEASCRLTPPDEAEDLAWRTLSQASAIYEAGDLARARSLAERAAADSPTNGLRARRRCFCSARSSGMQVRPTSPQSAWRSASSPRRTTAICRAERTRTSSMSHPVRRSSTPRRPSGC